MTKTNPSYYGVSVKDGDDAPSQSRPEMIVKTAYPLELAKLVEINSWKKDAMRFAASNVFVDHDGKFITASIARDTEGLPADDGGPYSMTSVLPIEDISAHDAEIHESIYDAVSGDAFEFASADVWAEKAQELAINARWETESRWVGQEAVAAIVNDDYSGMDDNEEAICRSMLDDFAADGWQVSASEVEGDLTLMRERPTWTETSSVVFGGDGPIYKMDHNAETRSFFEKAGIGESLTKFLPKFRLDDRNVVEPVFFSKGGEDLQIERNVSNLMIQQIQEAVDNRSIHADLEAKVVELRGLTAANLDPAGLDLAAPKPAIVSPEKLTFAGVQKELAGVGLTISRREGELRINYKGASEDYAYYAGDVEDRPDYADALATGKAMAAWKVSTAEKFGADYPTLKGTGPAFVSEEAYAANQREILAAAPELQPGYVDPEDRAYESDIQAWEDNGIANVERDAEASLEIEEQIGAVRRQLDEQGMTIQWREDVYRIGFTDPTKQWVGDDENGSENAAYTVHLDEALPMARELVAEEQERQTAADASPADDFASRIRAGNAEARADMARTTTHNEELTK